MNSFMGRVKEEFNNIPKTDKLLFAYALLCLFTGLYVGHTVGSSDSKIYYERQLEEGLRSNKGLELQIQELEAVLKNVVGTTADGRTVILNCTDPEYGYDVYGNLRYRSDLGGGIFEWIEMEEGNEGMGYENLGEGRVKTKKGVYYRGVLTALDSSNDVEVFPKGYAMGYDKETGERVFVQGPNNTGMDPDCVEFYDNGAYCDKCEDPDCAE